MPWNDRDFHRLPPFQTTARLAGTDREGDRVPVTLTARINELGLLHVACVSKDPDAQGTWPLEFDLRPHESSPVKDSARDDDEAIDSGPWSGFRADLRVRKPGSSPFFPGPSTGATKFQPANLLKSLERILGKPKADWNYLLIRSLWRSLNECFSNRKESVEHEETWLILAGYFLRPGFGAKGDDARINELWRIHTDGLEYPGKRNQLQTYILWRRVAGGLNSERQETILAPELSKLRAPNQPRPQNLSGSLDRWKESAWPPKPSSSTVFSKRRTNLPCSKQHAAPYLAALGLLLNRSLFYAGPEFVLPAVHVEKAYEALSDLDWTEPHLAEIQTLFLRAARIVNDPKIDLPKSLREKIASKLQKAGVSPSKVARLRSYVPVALADRANLFGESLPPGLVISVPA